MKKTSLAKIAAMSPFRLAAALLCLSLGAEAQVRDLEGLALSLVNEARATEGLPPLEPGRVLDDAAQGHADDMLARDFYSHVSPEGTTVRDRFLDAGGSGWSVVAENIAKCTGCDTPAGRDRVRAFQSGWMQSPGHRANILMDGIDRFGFGIASGDGVVYAVQMFAGSGTSPGAGEGGSAAPASDAEIQHGALEAANGARRQADQPALEMSGELNGLAAAIAAEATIESDEMSLPSDTFGLLPEGAGGWRGLSVAAEACGGCGAFAAEGDGAHFGRRVLPVEGAGRFTHFGFALRASGDGRKIAVGVIGHR